MDLGRFREIYARVGFWKFWVAMLALALFAYLVFWIFVYIVGPYIAGLWLIYS
jgi:hypothetical protein